MLILCVISVFTKNHSVSKIMWKNMVEPDRPQTALLIRRNDLCMLDD